LTLEQMDLFALDESGQVSSKLIVLREPLLNGFYYEERTRQFVSYCNGRRHFEIQASKCKGLNWPWEWQEKIMRERSI
jgi:hypothetical protein